MTPMEPNSRMDSLLENAEMPTCDSGCATGYYFGHPNQLVSSGGELVFSRYYPTSPAGPAATLSLPRGTYLITYTVNASAAKVMPLEGGSPTAYPVTSATVGIAPKLNAEPFPRGGSFATVPLNVDIGGSAALSGTFIAPLGKMLNTIGFYNTAKEPFATDYQLLNITVTKIC